MRDTQHRPEESRIGKTVRAVSRQQFARNAVHSIAPVTTPGHVPGKRFGAVAPSGPLLSRRARYGLVPIAGPSVDDAPPAALGTLKGKLLVSVIDAIGQPQDPNAVDALTRLMDGVAQGAAPAGMRSTIAKKTSLDRPRSAPE